MEDGLTLNIDVQGDESNHKPHVGWRERKQQARELQAKKRQRYSKGQGSRPGAVPAAGVAGVPQQQQQQQQRQQQQQHQQQQPQPVQQLQQPKQASAQHPRQQHISNTTKGAVDAKPGSKRSADTLHGYGAVLAQQQPGQEPPTAASKAAAASAADGRPKKRSNIAETAAAAAAAAEAMTADEQADIMALVQLNMSVEQQLEQEQQQQQGSGKKGSKKAAAVEQAVPGVVEFGDAPDELDAHDLLAKAGRRTHGKQQQQQQHGAGSREDKAGTKQQQQQDAKEPKQKQQLAQHKVGEMAHAELNVPAEQRQQLFGDAAAAGPGGGSDGSWSDLGLSEVLADHLVALNFQEPTQVQQRCVPVLLAGRDALVRSPTGSGKTLAYLAPLLHSLQAQQPRITRADGTHALILVPTRELAVQVSDVLTALVRRFCWLVAGMLIGGEHRGHEKARLRKGVTLLVATPGRLLDHLQNTTSFRTERLSWLVLDEADRLLDLGFEAKLKAIIEALAARAAAAADNSFSPAAHEGSLQCQTVLLSATLHPGLAGLASLSMREPVGVGFDAKLVDGRLQLQEIQPLGDEAGGQKPAGKGGAAAGASSGQEQFELPQQLQQRYVEVPAKARLVALIGVLLSRLRRSREAKLVVFFSNCDSVDFHHALLQQQQPGGGDPDSYDAAAAAGGGDGGGELLLGGCPVLKLHGDMKQPERTSSLVTFSKAKSCVLLCTDVAARGLDFPAVSTIIQYDPSGDPAEYVHRVGRTARMGQQGEALLFLLPSETPYAQLLQQQGVKLGQEQLGMLLQCLPALGGKGGPSAAVQQMARKMRKGSGAGMGSVTTSSSKDGSSRGSGGLAAAAAGFDGLEGMPSVKPEQAAAALLLQRQLAAVVSRDAELSHMATSAFRSFVRAYTTHPAALKHVFYVKGLHLGHLAASFGLREAPTKIGAAGSAAERKKRKQQGQHATNKREKQAWHKNAKAAAAMGRG